MHLLLCYFLIWIFLSCYVLPLSPFICLIFTFPCLCFLSSCLFPLLQANEGGYLSDCVMGGLFHVTLEVDEANSASS